MFPPVSLDVGAAIKTLVLTLDLLGTFVFALSGAVAGVRRRLDLFGVLVLAFVAANSGGIVRDVLIGATPPAAIRDWRYLAASLLAGVLIFYWYPSIKRLRSPVLVFDAAGLALFCVAGAQKAIVFGLPPVMAALLGMLTGVGGGVARDVLPGTLSACAGAALCFGLRLAAIKLDWHLPVAQASHRAAAEAAAAERPDEHKGER